MDRRSILLAGAAVPFALASGQAAAQAPGDGRTFVLVHGAWHGGWCWRPVADSLRSKGHRVFTPTQTGLGERRHLLSREITLDTFVDDLTNLIEMEDLQNIILVGHSFGGLAVSGVADRTPDRVGHFVCLDSLLLEGGQSPFGVLPPDVVAARRKLVAEQGLGIAIPAPSVTAFGIPEDHRQAAWVRRHLTPHPVGTYESTLKLAGPLGNNRPRTYIHCTNPVYGPLEGSRQLVRRQQGWRWLEIATAHDAMVTAPDELSRMLLEIGAS
jgi:pimeloyl-ACP methyl ester carboxylesterase